MMREAGAGLQLKLTRLATLASGYHLQSSQCQVVAMKQPATPIWHAGSSPRGATRNP